MDHRAFAKPKRILVLDDDPILRMVAEPALKVLGYDVLLMADGLHDDSFFANLKVDSAIVDLGLPGISGLDVIAKLRASERGRDMPIFVITGSRDTGDINTCYEDGNVLFVMSKPVDWTFLTEQLQLALEARCP
ncbi:MAG: response regulator [Pseudomonadota bacterium]